MPTVNRRSYGVVPIAFGCDTSPIFLILRAYQNWDFPKGGADEGETPLDAAKREMIEETGIKQFTLDWGDESMETEIYSRDKVATYFLARVEKQEITLPVSAELGKPEHDEYRWVNSDEARMLLPTRLIPILNWAIDKLDAPLRKFRPLTDRQKALYGYIDANPELFSVDAALKRSEEMAKRSEEMVKNLNHLKRRRN